MTEFYLLLGVISFATCWLAAGPLLQKHAMQRPVQFRIAASISILILLLGLGLYSYLGVPMIVPLSS